MAAPQSPPDFAGLRRSGTALLTTFRRNGDAVATPVSVVVAGDRAWFATPADSGKAKRLARNPKVTLAPCTVGGRALGEPVDGHARLLLGQDRRRARRRLRPTTSLFWSFVGYRLRGKTMHLYEVTPASTGAVPDRAAR
jgi:uncharacterized protein